MKHYYGRRVPVIACPRRGIEVGDRPMSANPWPEDRVSVLGVIPARLASSRLPRKVLMPICGKPMLQRVYERVRASNRLDHLTIATDSEEIRDFCAGLQMPVIMTSPAHRSGTDRAQEAAERLGGDIIVNVQADEPLVDTAHVDALLKPFDRDPLAQVSTLRFSISPEEAADPNSVKVVCDLYGQALYFSRAVIPFDRGGGVRNYKHIGLYAYRRESLTRFHQLKVSPLEEAERLEQLRFLENGIPIRVVDAPSDTVGVDTFEDLLKVERILSFR